MESENILDIKDLNVSFNLPEGTVKVLDGINFTVRKDEVFGIVGESGCGKSVTASSILQLLPKNTQRSGEILLHTENGIINITSLMPTDERMRQIRGNDIAMIFQEPAASFSPVYTIGEQMIENIILHKTLSEKEAKEIALETIEKVKIPDPKKIINSYPFELSGGMLQRCMIALALSCNPMILIADEPTTALDVTIQAQILYLMKELQKEFESSIIFITHDLGVIAQMADRVAVMYLGKIVEEGTVYDIFNNPLHPYTRALMTSIPKIGIKKTRLEAIKGIVPDPFNKPKGCSFHNRCPNYITGVCDEKEPKNIPFSKDHTVACFLYGGKNDE
ncbi:ABC transporter ATP-binding protein [Petrotoga sp. 9T1HF07.CasAA.8.2]|uniref:ABC transporter ATP-binding protein n=1 Tax=Petrotoga sp. 9T1HF07.CasAA.8.2 TaxID=1434329 RepID=UPI000CC26787|nr:ABC transporter ATP-binding protein [Petrotoga sp. 9T1HF07.CasAA.8.2]PNR88190.1 ABC transporter ATP-binding protein [Petrotoga sp. 9T1HF07.CasAA.8.2]